ncbi:hypothetical protein [Fluviicola taffensis]|uniref:Lipoprotein n=1 Tax=Fluviicola taffensis (strain DSM 16823 / NCIMB 13979 / RW262) TaxID=755732 RepID=F2IK62_FLUTR|nr:hypothetical protein [Fluviicola taffensis]AEA42961.1 hypothetical protein Fluta_0960 [Fluviicola taffensis DSM 16823]
MKNIGLVGFLGFLVACSSGSTDEKTKEVSSQVSEKGLEESVKAVKAFEDSLKAASKTGTLEFSPETAVVYAEKCLAITHRFPKSDEAPRYMDKAHIIFASAGLNQRSVMIADSLIMRYSTYKNRAMVLESLAGSYDVFVKPRQKDKVKLYYELLLKENPKMDPAQRKQIEKRLKYVDLTFEEFISKAN